MPAPIHVAALYRYPVKGFSPEPLDSIVLAVGETVPHDRAYAIENGPSGFDPAAPSYFPKARFLMLMRNERMAEFRTRFDPQTGEFFIERDGALAVSASLETEEGRARLENWLAENFAAELRGAPRILSAPGHSFSDKPDKVIHLVNLASVRALEEEFGAAIDPLRFRPNILIDGAEPFAELEWPGRDVRIGGVGLTGEERTVRCAATNVDPETGRRDMQIPRGLMQRYGHSDFGIYLKVTAAGALRIGDALLA
ncbi:hypothetical protein SAMN05216548_1123 [Faunimonas pinastri]|uniref:MOSC domain-containing protein n=1 Tax=Faunimonas pinastri TaxID=1855383 RepID=A0A1H9LSQ4_9HYPH|nr:MOSC domain-containing protein [Faunimonas pinastri]SER14309.1 hypothetical protein SAMN05216548_1123 [Faunimonas pinastri]